MVQPIGHYTNTTPCNQFELFIVISKYNICLGAYQTFEKAYERISEMTKGKDLIEESNNCFTKYTTNEIGVEDSYFIYETLFTYDYKAPLITADDMKNKEYYFSNLKEF